MINLSINELLDIVDGSRVDAGSKNVIGVCPWCGKDKFGISIKKPGHPWQCFSGECGEKGKVFKLISFIDRLDLIRHYTNVDDEVKIDILFEAKQEEEVIDLDMPEVDMPDEYERVFSHSYLNGRGFLEDDYVDFEVGSSRNFKFRDYVVIPVIEEGRKIGYVSRHTSSKKDLDNYNKKAKKSGGYIKLRYRNSLDTDFSKMLYNYDSIIEGETRTVILCEGCFDVFNVCRELNLFENNEVACVATFGKKISKQQILKLQKKGVKNLIFLFDSDAVTSTKYLASKLSKYFNVLVGYIDSLERDAGDLEVDELEEILDNLYTPAEYYINIMPPLKLKFK